MKYHIPPKHEQVIAIANTPKWLEQYFKEEERKEILEMINKDRDNGNMECGRFNAVICLLKIIKMLEGKI